MYVFFSYVWEGTIAAAAAAGGIDGIAFVKVRVSVCLSVHARIQRQATGQKLPSPYHSPTPTSNKQQKQACLSEPAPAAAVTDELAAAAVAIDIVEEVVRLHPNTGCVDMRQPFRLVLVRLLEAEEEGGEGEGKEEEGEGDWCVVFSRQWMVLCV